MSEVRRSWPWLWIPTITHGAAFLSMPFAGVAVLLGAPQFAVLAIPVFVLGVFVGAIAWLLIYLPPRRDWGRRPRFVANSGPPPIFRFYDDSFSVREMEAGRVRTSRYTYDEAIDVSVSTEKSFWSLSPQGGTLRLLLNENGTERELVAPSLLAKRVAAEILEGKNRAREALLAAAAS
jgi:hypothetical protein